MAEMFIKETAAVWTPQQGEGRGALQQARETEQEGTLAMCLPAGGPAERALPCSAGLLSLAALPLARGQAQTSEINCGPFLGVLEDTLHLMPSRDLSTGHFSVCARAQAITAARQLVLPLQLLEQPVGRESFLESKGPKKWLCRELRKAGLTFWHAFVCFPLKWEP